MPGIRSDKISRIETKHETHFGWLNWTVLILYLVAMLGMGIYFMKRENGAEDFFKGGGRIPWWAAGITLPLPTWRFLPKPTPRTGPTTRCSG